MPAKDRLTPHDEDEEVPSRRRSSLGDEVSTNPGANSIPGGRSEDAVAQPGLDKKSGPAFSLAPATSAPPPQPNKNLCGQHNDIPKDKVPEDRNMNLELAAAVAPFAPPVVEEAIQQTGISTDDDSEEGRRRLRPRPGALAISGMGVSGMGASTEDSPISDGRREDAVTQPELDASVVMVHAEIAPNIDNVVAEVRREEYQRRTLAVEEALRRDREEQQANIVKADVVVSSYCRRKSLLIGGSLVLVAMVIALTLGLRQGPDLPVVSDADADDDNTKESDDEPILPPVILPDETLAPSNTPAPTRPPEWVQLGGDLVGSEENGRFGTWLSLSADGRRMTVTSSNTWTVHILEIGDDGSVTEIVPPLENSTWGLLSGDGFTFFIGQPYPSNIWAGPGQVAFYGYFGESRDPIYSGSIYGTDFSANMDGRGAAISYNGTVAAISTSGSSFEDEKARVAVVVNDDGSWTQIGQDIVADSFHATSLALSHDGSILAVGGLGVQVYQYRGIEGWAPLGSKIDDPNKYLSRISLSADGKRIAISSKRYSPSHGTVVMEYDSEEEEWVGVGDEIEADGDHYNLNQVALSGDGRTLAVSTRNGGSNDLENAVIGYVQVYHQSINGTWAPFGERIRGKSSVEVFGFSLALSYDGQRLGVGAPGNEDIPSAGHVRIYDYGNSIELYD